MLDKENDFHPLFEEIILKTQEDLPDEQIMEECYELFTNMLCRLNGNAKNENTVPTEVHKLKEFIDNHIEHELSIQDIADSIGRSHDSVNRLFKCYCNMTPYAYYIYSRIERAKELLLHTSLPIKKISEKLGYKSAMHFSKQFHKVTGMRASDYRRMAQGTSKIDWK